MSSEKDNILIAESHSQLYFYLNGDLHYEYDIVCKFPYECSIFIQCLPLGDRAFRAIKFSNGILVSVSDEQLQFI